MEPSVAEPWIAYQNRDAVVVSGPDAVTYLQGQLSQDVAALEVGGSAWSWVLQPAGKVDALVRVTRTGPDSLLVDVDAGYGPAVLARLTRFKLRTKADLEAATVTVMMVRGPGAAPRAAAVAASARREPDAMAGSWFGAPVLVVTALPPDPEAPDPEAPAPEAPGADAADVLLQDGSRWDEPDGSARRDGPELEAERIAAGVPAMGAELTDRTIPAETGLVAITASFTKGCYTGQELVARIDSRGGNVPRHLRRLRSATALVAGDELTNADGKVVGTVTSAAVHPEEGVVGLAYVARSVGAGDPVTSAAGPVTVLGGDG
jgi:folate-binding protein YgfZ